MNAREIASLWIVAIAAVFVIVWDYRAQLGAIVVAATGSPAPSPTNSPALLISGPSTNMGTNSPIPIVGNEFGALATFGNVMSGGVQNGGPDKIFGNIFDNLGGQE